MKSTSIIHYAGSPIFGEAGYDSKNRLVFRSEKDIGSYIGINVDNSNCPFKDTGFIVIDKIDAENIFSMLNEAIARLESGTRQDNDVEVFGDRAISYERLYDYLGKTIYKLEEK